MMKNKTSRTYTYLIIAVLICSLLAACSTQSAQIEEAPPQSIPQSIDETFTEFVDSADFSGAILVAKNDEVILSKGYGMADKANGTAFTADTPAYLGPISRTFSAMSLLILQEQGKLKLTDSVCDYIDDCPVAWQPVTLHHLLAQRSGIPSHAWNDQFWAMIETPHSAETHLAKIRTQPLIFEQGTDWEAFNEAETLLVTQVVEHITDDSYANFLETAIFTPLGMTNSGHLSDGKQISLHYEGDDVVTYDASNFMGMADLYSTVNDLFKWEQALTSDVLVPQQAVAEMFKWHSEMTFEDFEIGYGYGWFLGNNDFYSNRHLYAQPPAGGYVDHAYFKNDDTVFIMLSNQNNIAERYLNVREKQVNYIITGIEAPRAEVWE